VIEAPEAVPDSDGRVTVDEGEEVFVVSHELEARTGLGTVTDDGDTVAIHCGTPPGAVVC
jgi:hypothetical protein